MDLRLQQFSNYSVTVVTEKRSSLIPSTWPVKLQFEHFWLQLRVLPQNEAVPNGKAGSECYIITEKNLSCQGLKSITFNLLHTMKIHEVTKIQFSSVRSINYY